MGNTILLADDSLTIQKVVELTFADTEYVVHAVSSGDELMRKLPECRPDLIICDIIMPGKDGYEVCQEIKSNPSTLHLPVILLTGTFEPFDRDRALAAGCSDIITKPFEARKLVEAVEKLLQQAAPAPKAAAAAPATEGPAQDVISEAEVVEEEDFATRLAAPPPPQVVEATAEPIDEGLEFTSTGFAEMEEAAKRADVDLSPPAEGLDYDIGPGDYVFEETPEASSETADEGAVTAPVPDQERELSTREAGREFGIPREDYFDPDLEEPFEQPVAEVTELEEAEAPVTEPGDVTEMEGTPVDEPDEATEPFGEGLGEEPAFAQPSPPPPTGGGFDEEPGEETPPFADTSEAAAAPPVMPPPLPTEEVAAAGEEEPFAEPEPEVFQEPEAEEATAPSEWRSPGSEEGPFEPEAEPAPEEWEEAEPEPETEAAEHEIVTAPAPVDFGTPVEEEENERLLSPQESTPVAGDLDEETAALFDDSVAPPEEWVPSDDQLGPPPSDTEAPEEVEAPEAERELLRAEVMEDELSEEATAPELEVVEEAEELYDTAPEEAAAAVVEIDSEAPAEEELWIGGAEEETAPSPTVGFAPPAEVDLAEISEEEAGEPGPESGEEAAEDTAVPPDSGWDEETGREDEYAEELPAEVAAAPMQPPAEQQAVGEDDRSNVDTAPVAEEAPPEVRVLSDQDIERIARKVLELAQDRIEQIAWEVVPDMAEIAVRERIRELEDRVEREGLEPLH